MNTSLSTLFQIQGNAISVNDAFYGRHIKTTNCRQFEKDVFKQLRKRPMRTGWVEMRLTFYLNKKRFAVSDISNLVKILEDCIVKAGYIEDDRKIVRMQIEKRPSENERIEVEISTYHDKNN